MEVEDQEYLVQEQELQELIQYFQQSHLQVVEVVVMPLEEYKTDLMEDLVVVLQMMETLSLHRLEILLL